MALWAAKGRLNNYSYYVQSLIISLRCHVLKFYSKNLRFLPQGQIKWKSMGVTAASLRLVPWGQPKTNFFLMDLFSTFLFTCKYKSFLCCENVLSQANMQINMYNLLHSGRILIFLPLFQFSIKIFIWNLECLKYISVWNVNF